MPNEVITFRVNGETYYLPSSSSYLLTHADPLHDLYDVDAFYPLLERTGRTDTEKRPVYLLSQKMAYQDTLLHDGDAEMQASPVLSALYHKIKAHSDQFIPLSKVLAGEAEGLYAIKGHWALFIQSPFIKPRAEQNTPKLFAGRLSGGGPFFLPGKPVTGLGELDSLHENYFLTSTGVDGTVLHGLFLEDEEDAHVEDAWSALDGMRDALQQQFSFSRIDSIRMQEMIRLSEDDMGLGVCDAFLQNDGGTYHQLNGHIFEEPGAVNVTLFGLVRPEGTDASGLFIDPSIESWQFSGALGECPASPHFAHIVNALNEKNRWPDRIERPHFTQRVLHRLKHLVFGDG